MTPEYMMASITKHLNRGGYRDLTKAKWFLEKLIVHQGTKELDEIDVLGGFSDALLGAVYEADGTPVPCYDLKAVIDQLISEGLSENEAAEAIERTTEGLKVLWIRDPELRGWPDEPNPTLKICH
jgi:hypothetical protein